MAVHTFSTRDKTRPADEELVQRIKNLPTIDYNLRDFTSIVIEALANWEEAYESRNISTNSSKD